MADKMMRVAGRNPLGFAMPLQVDEFGLVRTVGETIEVTLFDDVLFDAGETKVAGFATSRYSEVSFHIRVEKEGYFRFSGTPFTKELESMKGHSAQEYMFAHTKSIVKNTGWMPVKFGRLNCALTNSGDEPRKFTVIAFGKLV